MYFFTRWICNKDIENERKLSSSEQTIRERLYYPKKGKKVYGPTFFLLFDITELAVNYRKNLVFMFLRSLLKTV